MSSYNIKCICFIQLYKYNKKWYVVILNNIQIINHAFKNLKMYSTTVMCLGSKSEEQFFKEIHLLDELKSKINELEISLRNKNQLTNLYSLVIESLTRLKHNESADFKFKVNEVRPLFELFFFSN